MQNDSIDMKTIFERAESGWILLEVVGTLCVYGCEG